MARRDGCSVASLGGFGSVMMHGLRKKTSGVPGMRLTSGSLLTSALIVKSIVGLAVRGGFELENKAIGIVGASGEIGNGCVKYFGNKAGSLHL
ncbi:MAG: hypothetical protein GF398_21910 [Chitinivibrionales bacterium]|nr:hypothetical protein [Chitinivibrionales bacterium]